MSNNTDTGQEAYYPPSMYGSTSTIVGPGVSSRTPGVYGFDTIQFLAYFIGQGGIPVYIPSSISVSTALANSTALLDGLSLSGSGVDNTGVTDVLAAINTQTAANRGRLGHGVFRISDSIIIPVGVKLSGDSSRSTTIVPYIPDNGYAVQTVGNPVANDYPGRDVVLENLSIDGIGAPNKLTLKGLRIGGAHRIVRNVRVKEFGVGIVYDQSHTYINRLQDFSSYANVYGVVFETGITDSGENINLENGAIFNNTHNLFIKDAAWDITLRDVSLDYPTNNQILVSSRVQLLIHDGHIENGGGVALVGAVNPGTDAGIIRFIGTSFAGSANATSVANDLIGPNINSVTLVFTGCADVVTGQRFNRVVWRQPTLPTVPPPSATPWQNTTGVTARVTLTYNLPVISGSLGKIEAFAGSVAAGLPMVGTLYAPANAAAQLQVLIVDIPHRYYFGVAISGATFAAMTIEGLA